MFLSLLADQFANKERCLRGTLLNDKYPRILPFTILLSCNGINLPGPEKYVRSDLLRMHHCMVDNHSYSLLREQP